MDPKVFYENCMYDICECRTSLKECMCDSLATYADECAKNGIEIPWRQKVPMCGKFFHPSSATTLLMDLMLIFT